MGAIIEKTIRSLLFSMADVSLKFMDLVWGIIQKVATLDISSILDDWFTVICIFLSFFIILKASKIIIKSILDEDYRNGRDFDVSKIIIRITISSLLVGLIPIGFSYVSKVSSDAITNISYFTPVVQTDPKPSNIILQSGRVDIGNVNKDLSSEIVYSETFDINAVNDNNEWAYFPNYTSIFLLIAESAIGCYLFVVIGVHIAKRFYDIAFKYMLAPYCIASYIEPDNQTFSTWIKLVLGDFLMQFCQIYALYLALFICNNGTIATHFGSNALGVLAQIFFFVAALTAVLNLPSTISNLIGGTGQGSLQALQDINTGIHASRAVATGAAVAGIAAVGAGVGAIGGMMGRGSEHTQLSNARHYSGDHSVAGKALGAMAIGSQAVLGGARGFSNIMQGAKNGKNGKNGASASGAFSTLWNRGAGVGSKLGSNAKNYSNDERYVNKSQNVMGDAFNQTVRSNAAQRVADNYDKVNQIKQQVGGGRNKE